MASEQLVVFRLGNEEYAVAISKVKEIIYYNGASKLPKLSRDIEGIINLRGKIIPVVNLIRRFDLISGKEKGRQAVIVEASGTEIGILVDEVREVLRIEEQAIDTLTSMSRTNPFIKGIGKVNDRLLIILDLDKVFSQEDLDMIKDAG